MEESEEGGNSAVCAFGRFIAALSDIVRQIEEATDETELGPLWDQFWERNPDGADFGADMTSYLLPILRKRESSRILCVGNGKALEAHALAAAGFRVDSLDISPAANQFLASLTIPSAVLTRILREPCEGESAPPVIHTGDFCNATHCPGPYDVVIIRRTMQYCHADAMPLVMERLCNRLTDTGLLVVQDHNQKKSMMFAARWLGERKVPVAWNICVRDGRAFALPGLGTCRRCRVAWLIRSSG